MKANELMVGDLIKTNSRSWNDETLENKYCKVETVGQNYLSCSLIDNPKRKPYGEGTSFEPIPLTPEILEKNGFGSLDESGVSYRIDAAKRMSLSVLGNDAYIDDMDASYVHQLQHALRLCGIEKEIIL